MVPMILVRKLTHRQFVNYLNCKTKIAKQQSGNRQFYSTETALLHPLHRWDPKKYGRKESIPTSLAWYVKSIWQHQTWTLVIQTYENWSFYHRTQVFQGLPDRPQSGGENRRYNLQSAPIGIWSAPRVHTTSTLTTCHQYQDIARLRLMWMTINFSLLSNHLTTEFRPGRNSSVELSQFPVGQPW